MSVVLVTGAGGFLGSAASRALVAAGHDVVGLVRPGGSPARLELLREHASFRIERADLADEARVAELVHRVRPDVVVHVALDREAYLRVDDELSVAPVAALLAGLERLPERRLIHTSSAWVLGHGVGLAEHAPVAPASAYASNKARADETVPALADRAGVEWMILRPFNLFGRYEDERRLLPYLVDRLSRGEEAELSHGAQLRDFNDVDGLAQAYAAALDAPPRAWRALYHLGSGRATSARAFAELVAGQFGRHDLLKTGATATADDAVPALVADATRAREELAWSPAASLEDDVAAAVKWWLERLGRTRPRRKRIEHEVAS